jgi:pimeloyl-ACP methyl ester carboxylesterase
MIASTLSAAIFLSSCSSTPEQKAASQNQTRAVASGIAARAKNIVIVHGAFADGSGWEGVFRILTNDGYHVTIVQNPLVSLDADVKATQDVLDAQDGPAVLVGHSYGGAVITQAGNDLKVKSLVYVAAYLPDAGESVGDLLGKADPAAVAPPIQIDPKKGTALIDRSKFPEFFAADIDRNKAEFLAASQAPLGLAAVSAKLTTAAWKSKPSFYIVASEDRMIPPSDERKFAKRAGAVQEFEIKASHAVFISQPDQVAKVIEQAAE